MTLTNQQHFLKELGKINQVFKQEYQHDMLIILHKLIGDNLCVEDIESLCRKRGIEDILEEYYKCVSLFEDDDNEEEEF